jgi:hypothetical protein
MHISLSVFGLVSLVSGANIPNNAPNITTPAVRRYEIREPYKLDLMPYVSIGVSAARPGPRHDPPPGHRVVCPNDRAYCIDYQSSDNGTCMYPDPLEIKRCYDSSCTSSAWASLVRKQRGEDTYCKDFMTPQGRVCQWIDSVPCSCESRSIYYYSGEFIPNDQPVPYGFSEAHHCTYPLDVIRRAAEEAARKARRVKRGNRKQRRNKAQDPSNPEENTDEPQVNKRQRSQQESNDSFSDAHAFFAAIVISVIII